MIIRISIKTNSQHNVAIYTVDGEKVFQETATQPLHILNIEPLTNGTYVLRIVNKQKSYTAKFVKH